MALLLAKQSENGVWPVYPFYQEFDLASVAVVPPNCAGHE